MPLFASKQLIGHCELRSQLAALHRNSSLPHSLILAGPEGVGKTLIARAVAEQILCEGAPSPNLGGCGECPSCNLLLSENHPDLFISNLSNDGVEEIRKLLSAISLTPFRSKAKVALLLNSHDLTVQAANTLLKSLEEPRPSTYFILVSDNLTKILATIRSRCQLFRVQPLKIDDIQAILKQLGLHHPNSKLLNSGSLASGSMVSISLLENHAEELEDYLSLFSKVSEGDTDTAMHLASSLAQKKELLGPVLKILREQAREQMIKSLNSHTQAVVLARFIENSIAAERTIFERNLNPNLVMNFILVGLANRELEPLQNAII